jgi:hypothetical protein
MIVSEYTLNSKSQRRLQDGSPPRNSVPAHGMQRRTFIPCDHTFLFPGPFIAQECKHSRYISKLLRPLFNFRPVLIIAGLDLICGLAFRGEKTSHSDDGFAGIFQYESARMTRIPCLTGMQDRVRIRRPGYADCTTVTARITALQP